MVGGISSSKDPQQQQQQGAAAAGGGGGKVGGSCRLAVRWLNSLLAAHYRCLVPPPRLVHMRQRRRGGSQGHAGEGGGEDGEDVQDKKKGGVGPDARGRLGLDDSREGMGAGSMDMEVDGHEDSKEDRKEGGIGTGLGGTRRGSSKSEGDELQGGVAGVGENGEAEEGDACGMEEWEEGYLEVGPDVGLLQGQLQLSGTAYEDALLAMLENLRAAWPSQKAMSSCSRNSNRKKLRGLGAHAALRGLLAEAPVLPVPGVVILLEDVLGAGGAWATAALGAAREAIVERPVLRPYFVELVLAAATGAMLSVVTFKIGGAIRGVRVRLLVICVGLRCCSRGRDCGGSCKWREFVELVRAAATRAMECVVRITSRGCIKSVV
eukprot:1157494-Pelagomonas_calceolata.AAC.4